MRISVINFTHGLLSDQEIITAIRAVNRQISEDFALYWNIYGTLRLEGNSLDRPDINSAKDRQGEAILYLWDKSDISNALGYHQANYRGIPYGFVFVDIATEIGENWTVTFSHEVLELLGDRQANKLVQGPHPSEDRTVYYWHEMCDAVQNEFYEIDGVAVSNFVLPLYFTEDAETGSRNDFLGTQYRLEEDGPTHSLRSFGVNPGGYVGYFDPKDQQHHSQLGKILDPKSRKATSAKAEYRRTRKNKARMARRGNRYTEMGCASLLASATTSNRGVVQVASDKKKRLQLGKRKLTVLCKATALTLQTDVLPLQKEKKQQRGYFSHDIDADAAKVSRELKKNGFDEIGALTIDAVPAGDDNKRPEAEITIEHSDDEAIIALIEVDGLLLWQTAQSSAQGSSSFAIKTQTIAQSLQGRRGFLLQGIKTVVRFIRHKIKDRIKKQVTEHLSGYLAKSIEKLAFRKKKSARLDTLRLLSNPKNKTIGEIKALRGKLKSGKKYLLLIHGIFSSSKSAFNELLLDRHEDQWLRKVAPHYAKIVSFDHWTVARSTLENASELLAMLPDDCQLDIVCHSRGAGVTRCLLEHPKLAPQLEARKIRLGKAIFVAGACQGSQLAKPDRIGLLVNVFSALNHVSNQFTPVALITGLLKAVQYGVTEFPGIQSMNPDDPVFAQLNRPINQKNGSYIYSRSDYEPAGTLGRLLDEVGLDRYIFKGKANDGVVPFEGAGTFDEEVEKTIPVIKGPEYGVIKKEHVFHTRFFEQKDLRLALIQYLTQENG